jgi:hypothetical protein
MSVTRTFTVTVVSTGSGNKYFIDGVQQATILLGEGGTYKFDQSDSSNGSHPLRFSTTSDGTHSGGDQYTTGVTTNGSTWNAGAYTQIVVAESAPTLYYYCIQITQEWVDKLILLTEIHGDLCHGVQMNTAVKILLMLH